MIQRHQADSMMSLYLRQQVKEISYMLTNNVCDQANQSMRCKHPSILWVIHFLGVPFSITQGASKRMECNPWKGAISLILTVKYNEMVKERRFHKCKQHSRWWHSPRTPSASLTTTASMDIVCQITSSMQSQRIRSWNKTSWAKCHKIIWHKWIAPSIAARRRDRIRTTQWLRPIRARRVRRLLSRSHSHIIMWQQSRCTKIVQTCRYPKNSGNQKNFLWRRRISRRISSLRQAVPSVATPIESSFWIRRFKSLTYLQLQDTLRVLWRSACLLCKAQTEEIHP